MATNSLRPAWIYGLYTSYNGEHEHAFTIPVAPAAPFVSGTEPTLLSRNASVIAADTFGLAFAAAWCANLLDTNTLFSIDFFYQATKDDPPAFVWTYPANQSGSITVGADILAQEQVFTFKTPTIGGLRLVQLESYQPIDVWTPANDVGSGSGLELIDYILSDTDVIVGRNGEYPVRAINLITKENDYLRKKYKAP